MGRSTQSSTVNKEKTSKWKTHWLSLLKAIRQPINQKEDLLISRSAGNLQGEGPQHQRHEHQGHDFGGDVTSLGGKKFETQTVLSADWRSETLSQALAGSSDAGMSHLCRRSLCSCRSPKAPLRAAASQKTTDEETEPSSKVPLPKVETLLGIYYSPRCHVVLSQ